MALIDFKDIEREAGGGVRSPSLSDPSRECTIRAKRFLPTSESSRTQVKLFLRNDLGPTRFNRQDPLDWLKPCKLCNRDLSNREIGSFRQIPRVESVRRLPIPRRTIPEPARADSILGLLRRRGFSLEFEEANPVLETLTLKASPLIRFPGVGTGHRRNLPDSEWDGCYQT